MLKQISTMRVLSALLLGGLLTLGACKKKDDGGGAGGGNVAATPCTATCDSSVYSTLPGLTNPTAYTYGANGGFCGCGYGNRPIYNSQWGFACVPSNTLNYSAYWGYNTSTIYQSQNTQAMNMQQVSYTPLQYGADSNCFSSIAASCDVRAVNSCTNGGTCRPIGGGSSVGVCTTGTGVDNYNATTTTNPVYDAYNPYYNYGYNSGYGYNNGGYSSGGANSNCRYRQNSWGFYYYSCGF
jgi:hypothetical protein